MFKLFTLLTLGLIAYNAQSHLRCSILPPLPDFIPYYDRFERATGISPYCVAIKYDPKLTGDIIGQCSTARNLITISPQAWAKYSSDEREWLIAHELGHCLLGRDHEENQLHTRVFDDIPKSIMYPTIADKVVFKHYKAQYYRELVTGVF